jgi:MFS family permease
MTTSFAHKARSTSVFKVLNGPRRELCLSLGIKLLNFAAYTVTNLTLTLWLSHEFGLSDPRSLAIVFSWGLTMTIITVLSGPLTDAIGVRRAFFLGIWVCLFARAVMIFCAKPLIALGIGLFSLAIGEALGTPALVASIRQFSTASQRSTSFSISYVLMSVGSFIAAYLFDWVRKHLGEHGHFRGCIVRYRLIESFS